MCKTSVCLATYNGEKYIEEQLNSILKQLSINDEVIISDDSSTDKTIEIIKSYKDNRIKIYGNQKFNSPIFNFENAINNATGDIIVLSDQDDIWMPTKIKIIKETMPMGSVFLILYNGNCIDSNGNILYNDLFEYIHVHNGLINNIIKNSFIGCNIAFTKELKEVILPFPRDIPMHDMWIGGCAYLFGTVEFKDEKIFSYRLHNNNYTGKKTSVRQKIVWRFKLVKNLVIRYFNVKYTN